MSSRLLAASAAVLVALLLPAAVSAKGPSEATITGPGLASAIHFAGPEGGNHALTQIVMAGGFFPQVFGQSPDPILASKPKGKLGQRYDVTYTLPGPEGATDSVDQELYPFAAGGAVTFMQPDQRFWDNQRTRGGWFRASSALKATLVQAGLKRPARKPADSSRRAIAVSAAAGVLLAGAGLALFRRRR